jgi:hypothetical protein
VEALITPVDRSDDPEPRLVVDEILADHARER